MYDNENPKYRKLKNGQYVRLLKEIKNNGIILKPMTRGKIVHAQNQVEADIWFFDSSLYKNAVNLETDFYKNGRFEGVVLHVKGDSFAINFNYSEHSSVIISEEKALVIPFFNGWNEKKIPSHNAKMVDNEMTKQCNYLLLDIIDYVEDAFTDWVEKNTDTREITDEEREYEVFPDHWDHCFTDDSLGKFIKMQENLELKFAQQTGFYHHFMGGTVED